MTYALIDGAGYAGSAIAHELADAGHRVRGMVDGVPFSFPINRDTLS